MPRIEDYGGVERIRRAAGIPGVVPGILPGPRGFTPTPGRPGTIIRTGQGVPFTPSSPAYNEMINRQRGLGPDVFMWPGLRQAQQTVEGIRNANRLIQYMNQLRGQTQQIGGAFEGMRQLAQDVAAAGGDGGDGGGDGGDGGWPAPAPWAVNLQFPQSPFRQWFMQNVPWYNPMTALSEGQVAGLDPQTANQLLVLNALLPFLGQEDVGSMARFLSMATGGGTGPFAGYLQAPPVPSPVRQQVGEARRLEDALAVARLMSEPGSRALSEGVLGLGLSGIGAGGRPDGILGPQDIVARSRAGQMRFLGELGGFGGTQGPGGAIAPFLQRLAQPTQLRPLPGQLTRTDGGFQVAPNLRWLVG